MTSGDRVLVALVSLAVVASVPISAAALAGGSKTAALTSPAGETRLDLTRARQYTVQGRNGTLVLEVADGAVRCVESSCPDGVCVRSGVARPGKPVVCAPNAVVVSVSRGAEGDFDAVSR